MKSHKLFTDSFSASALRQLDCATYWFRVVFNFWVYYKSSNDPDYGDSFMPSMCLGSAITCTFASILSFCGVFTQDYASDIAK